MTSVICTLMEGDYHYGLGALANSLYCNDYRGDIWVGYRGDLPPWVKQSSKRGESIEFQIASDCTIKFLEIHTESHFTNFKPFFMLKLIEELASDAESIVYFDPDIVIKCKWSYIQNWISYGIALCEDINSPVPLTNPLRRDWESFYAAHGFRFNPLFEMYVNGGFVGISKGNFGFLRLWARTLELMAPLTKNLTVLGYKDRTFLFHKPDQDALNVALMCSEWPVSLMGKEGMDFIPGGFTMSHALGTPKPWQKLMIMQALRGRPPGLADKGFLQHCNYPVRLYSLPRQFLKRIDVKCGAAIGRIIGRR